MSQKKIFNTNSKDLVISPVMPKVAIQGRLIRSYKGKAGATTKWDAFLVDENTPLSVLLLDAWTSSKQPVHFRTGRSIHNIYVKCFCCCLK